MHSPLAWEIFLRSLKDFQLEVQLFNLIAAGVVYMTKLLFVTMAVTGFFIAIRYGMELPAIVTAVNVIMVMVGTFNFMTHEIFAHDNFMCDAAVWMPSRFAGLVYKMK